MSRYHLERSSRLGRWKTVLSSVDVDRVPSYSLRGSLTAPGALQVARIEVEEDGSPLRLYDIEGREIRTPFSRANAASTLSALGASAGTGRQWAESFLPTVARSAGRRAALERQLGTGIPDGDRVRFRHVEGDTVREAVVDKSRMAPLEHIERVGETVTARRSFTYAPASEGDVVRIATHSEHRTVADVDDHTIVDTSFSNVRLEAR